MSAAALLAAGDCCCDCHQKMKLFNFFFFLSRLLHCPTATMSLPEHLETLRTRVVIEKDSVHNVRYTKIIFKCFSRF
jgi:hypothetical protein